MKKKNNTKNNIAIRSMIFITILALVLIFVYIIFPSPPSPASNDVQQTELFQSKQLGFSIQVPAGYEVKSSNTGVDLIKKGENIEIVRNGTQFNNISEYLKEFDSRRNIQVESLESLNIAGYETIKRLEKREVGGQSKNPQVYYILINNAVYILSTDYNDLFPNLDQIAQSFRYNP